jgi:hypothetical protein
MIVSWSAMMRTSLPLAVSAYVRFRARNVTTTTCELGD